MTIMVIVAIDVAVTGERVTILRVFPSVAWFVVIVGAVGSVRGPVSDTVVCAVISVTVL